MGWTAKSDAEKEFLGKYGSLFDKFTRKGYWYGLWSMARIALLAIFLASLGRVGATKAEKDAQCVISTLIYVVDFLLLVALKPHNKGTDKDKAIEESKEKIEGAKGDGASAADKTAIKAAEGGVGVGATGMEGSTGGAGMESSATSGAMPEACNGMLAILQDETVMQTVDAILRVAM